MLVVSTENINKTQTLSLVKDVNELLCKINDRLAKITKDKLNNERYGASKKINTNNFFILAQYKKILQDKAQNSCCLREYLIDDIISNIKQYLTSGKPQKFKKCVAEIAKANKGPEEPASVNVEIKYNYGSYTVNNNYSNKFVNVTEEDKWDQVDF